LHAEYTVGNVDKIVPRNHNLDSCLISEFWR